MIFFRDALLQNILSQPTAPFREGRVISEITQELESSNIPYFVDPIGNIVVGVRSQTEYLALIRKASDEPVRLFIAHMDHPGFHGVRWISEREIEIKWLGGSPTQHLESASVWLADPSGWSGKGQMKNAKLLQSGRAIETAMVTLSSESTLSETARSKPTRIYGGFSFRAPWWKEGELIYTKAADDLVGVFAILSLALDQASSNSRNSRTKKSKLKSKKDKIPFIGLLTRAEEVGFIGAIGHFDLGWLEKARRPILCVSLETSRTLPGAEIGKGPVIRLGDKFTVFDPGALKVFSDLAHTVLPEKHQRRVMDGGTCEATAATVFGYSCIGISVPLGNYHNQSLECGPDAAPPHGPAPEFVHSHDILGLIQLCHALLKPELPWAKPWQKKMKEMKKEFRGYGPLLRSGP